jgi:formamidopyrimidine-DNA glycosylase
MPELPEVETVRQDLSKKILHHTITVVQVLRPQSVGKKVAEFIQALTGNSFIAIERRGKLMIFRLQKGKYGVLVHLKMTGQLIYERESKNKIEVVAGGHKLSESDIENLPNKHTRVVIVFADGGQLFFNDLRVFGYMKLANEKEIVVALKKFGPEPLTKDFTWEYFSSLFQKRAKAPIKALLLNQELIAGLGNIYVDEVCFCAGVKPMRRVNTITKAEQKKLFKCIPKILSKAIKHRGTTFRNFVDSDGKKGNYTDFLEVFGRGGKVCRRCGVIIKKIRCAGRGTHYCSGCQK